MAELLAIPADRIAVVPLGINMEGYEPRAARRRRRVPRRLLRARRAGEGAARAGRGLRAASAAGPAARRVRLEAAGYMAPAHAAVSRRACSGRSSAPASADEFTYHGAVDRDGKLAFLPALDVLSVPATYDEPKGDVPARGDGERRAGRAAAARRVHRDRGEDRRRPAGRRPTTRARWPTGCTRCGSDRGAAERARRSAPSTACARTTRIEQSADRLLDVYRDVGCRRRRRRRTASVA